MIRINDLKGIIVKNGYSQSEIAKFIGVTPETFYDRMKKGLFGSDEIQIMIKKLNIDNPMEIFLQKSNFISYKEMGRV